MYKSIADVFNSPNAIFNGPLDEIKDPVKPRKTAPRLADYENYLSGLGYNTHPKPTGAPTVHHSVNPLHGALKPVNNYK